jgi:hypothetical protein
MECLLTMVLFEPWLTRWALAQASATTQRSRWHWLSPHSLAFLAQWLGC